MLYGQMHMGSPAWHLALQPSSWGLPWLGFWCASLHSSPAPCPHQPARQHHCQTMLWMPPQLCSALATLHCSFIHSFIDPLICSLAHDPFPHSSIHPSTHLFIHAFNHSFVRSFIHSCGFTKVDIYMYCMLCVIVMRYMVTCAVTVSQWCMMASRVQNMSRHSVSDCTCHAQMSFNLSL